MSKTAKIMNVNSLSQNDKDKLRKAIREMNDSMTRVASETELQKEILDKVCTELGLDKSVVKRMAKVFYKSSFTTEVEKDNTFRDFYSIVLNFGHNSVSQETV